MGDQDPNQLLTRGETVLHVVLRRLDAKFPFEMIKLLVDNGVDVYMKNLDGHTAMQVAIKPGVAQLFIHQMLLLGVVVRSLWLVTSAARESSSAATSRRKTSVMTKFLTEGVCDPRILIYVFSFLHKL